MLLTRSPLSFHFHSRKNFHKNHVRLACVKHAASVRPEPGSNSPNKNKNVKAQKNQPTKNSQPAIPTKNTQKQKTGINKTNKHTIEFTNNTHTIEDTEESAHFRKVFRAKFPRPSVSLRSLPFGATRRTLRTCPPIVKSRLFGPLGTHFRKIPRFSARFSATSGHFSAIFMPQNTECHTKCAPRPASNRSSRTPDLAL